MSILNPDTPPVKAPNRIPELKEDVAKYAMKPEVREMLAGLVSVSSQSIRLWIQKKDIRMLAYPIMLALAKELKCNIDDLLNF